jgi:UDP-N-acetylglucosamine diphosphorylase / glucose-1-phosphate thymidylyltransferase / UDP-N-acetylgalactosamine diphosphorylase / glucosamine-1-phosphate N-acetyltransferase / galactosamine-1-phosphate N-acetyltransferase
MPAASDAGNDRERPPVPGGHWGTAVVLCGGSGSRLWPLTLERQKAMLPVHGQPLIKSVVDFWAPFAERFVFIVKHGKEGLVDYLRTLPVRSAFAEPEALRGIANGLSYARPHVDDRFIVILGDCVCRGRFRFPERMELGVGVWRTSRVEDIRRSYSVETDASGSRLTRVVEKPSTPPNDLCGLGYYFFDLRVFDYISRTPPSALRNEVEITDVIENMIRAGEAISVIPFEGGYVNVTHPEDLETAASILAPPP